MEFSFLLYADISTQKLGKFPNELIITFYVSSMNSTLPEPGNIRKASCGNHVGRTCRKLWGKVLQALALLSKLFSSEIYLLAFFSC